MTRSHIKQQSKPEQSLTTQISPQRSLTISTISPKNLSNENYAPNEALEETTTSIVELKMSNGQEKGKQTLVECSDNILVNQEVADVNEIFEKISFDKMANDILLTKPTNQQTLANLKEKRRTVKELMSKFEKN